MIRIRNRAQQAAPDTVAPDVYPVDPDIEALADHGLHVQDETCARCGRQIMASDEARRTAAGACVHLSC